MHLWIGIDGGATKTRVVAVGEDGVVIAEGLAGATNYQIVGVDAACLHLQQAIQIALERIEASLPVAAIVAGIAGLDGPDDVEPVRQIMQSAAAELNDPTWWAVNDTVAAWAGALAGEAGVIVISGSGAAALAVGTDGNAVHADGWGHWLGDEGSGFDIGRRGLRAAVRYADQRGPATQLLDRLIERFGAAWPSWVTSLNAMPGDAAHAQIASFAPDVVEAADVGDEVASSVLGHAAESLAQTAAGVIRRAQLSSPVRVATVGSLFVHSRMLYAEFAKSLAQLVPGAVVNHPKRQPAEGAALLAQRPALIPKDVIVVRGA
ncbi:MAG: BadF/BadG/BcrA/BcrD ATPase family protein [Caldilineaceae bacterium]